jgi:hypothetical protein
MPSSGMLRRGALVRTDISEERNILLVSANIVHNSPILVALMMEALRSSESSVLTRATRRNIPEGNIRLRHRCENLKSRIALTGWAL